MKGFLLQRNEGWTFSVVPELAETAFVPLCCLPQGVCPDDVKSVVSSANTEVRCFNFQGKEYYLKEYFFLGWKKHLKLFRRGEKLVTIAHQLSEKGFLTPRVVAFGRCKGNRRVITEAIEGALDVWQVLYPGFRESRGDVSGDFMVAVGGSIGDLHRNGFFHGDLRWRNILTKKGQEGWLIYFIDNDRTQYFRSGIPFRCRVKNLSQFLFSGMLVNWPERDWQHFLNGYFVRSQISPSYYDKLMRCVDAKVRKRMSGRIRRGGK